MPAGESQDSLTMGPFEQSVAAIDVAHRMARRWIAGLEQQTVSQRIGPREMAALLDEPLPEQGCDATAVLEEWFRRAEPGIVASPGPRFFGFVNGGSSPAALAGDWLASAIDQNAGFWLSSPAAAQTELVVLRWLKELFSLPAAWSGTMTSGATMSNLVGLAAARQWVGTQLGFDPAVDGLVGNPPIPVISSTEIHASARKSLGTLGLGRGAVRLVDAPGGSIDPAALRAELARVNGPAIVIANAAEVNTGAFDAISTVADICDAHPAGVWLHVDGAFGLFAAVSPRYAHLADGVARADSVAADGHKWLNVPYDSGFVFVRDEEMLRRAFNAVGAYIAPMADTGWDPSSHVPEMSRRFRALAAWCALRAWGRDGYREVVERCCANASAFGMWVSEQPGLELLAPVPLNIVCFRYAPDNHDDAAIDAFNRTVCAALQRDGRIFVTETRWQGHVAIRAAFDNWATTAHDVDILCETVSEVGARVLAE